MNYKAIVVDDESKSCQVLEHWLNNSGAFSILGSFTNPVAAYEFLGTAKPEIIFLDINMPILNGIQFAEKAHQQYPEIKIVITTAHDQYAVQALNVGVYGFLLKPYNNKAVCELVGRLLTEPKPQILHDVITLSTKDKDFYFRAEDILYLVAVGNYTEIHTISNESILFSKTLKLIMDLLPQAYFKRLSRGLIVNTLYLQCIDKKRQTAMLKQPSGETLVLNIKGIKSRTIA